MLVKVLRLGKEPTLITSCKPILQRNDILSRMLENFHNSTLYLASHNAVILPYLFTMLKMCHIPYILKCM